MSFSGDTSDSEWKATKMKTEKIIKSDKKYYQQKFVERWLDRFKPWLARDVNDLHKPYCKACKCTLNCNKCHLQRHERTTKHRSNLREYLHANGLVPSKQNKAQRKERKERTKLKLPPPETENDESKFESVFMNVEFEGKKERLEDPVTQEILHDFHFVQTEHEVDVQPSRDNVLETNIVKRSDVSSQNVSTLKKDRQKLLLQIQKDKDELMSSFNELFTTAVMEKKEKNHVDLFFDSVSSSVKALSPKLISEAKMRVSQLICELELRAITENENACRDSASSTVLLAAPLTNAYIIDHQQSGNGSNQVGSSQKDASYGATD